MPVLMATVIMAGTTTAMPLITAMAGAIGHFVIIILIPITITDTDRIGVTTTGRRARVLTGKTVRGEADTADARLSLTGAEGRDPAGEAAFLPEAVEI